VALIGNYVELCHDRDFEFLGDGLSEGVGRLLIRPSAEKIRASNGCAYTIGCQRQCYQACQRTDVRATKRPCESSRSPGAERQLFWSHMRRQATNSEPAPTGAATPVMVRSGSPVWVMAALLVLLTGGLIVGLTVLLFVERRRYPFLLVGWLWFCGTLVPVIGLVQMGSQAMADRYTYIPSLGVLVLAVWGVCELGKGWHYRVVALSLAGSTAIVLCMALTRQRLGHWNRTSINRRRIDAGLGLMFQGFCAPC